MKNHDSEIVKVDLPHSDLILGLGISSIALSFLTGIIGIVLGIWAVYLFPKPYRLYQLAPELYCEGSFKNIKTGRTLGIIGLVISSVVFLVFLVVFVIVRGFIGLIS